MRETRQISRAFEVFQKVSVNRQRGSGHTFFTEGDQPDGSVYYLVTGFVGEYISNRLDVRKLKHVVRRGQVFGENDLSARSRLTTAQALTPVTVFDAQAAAIAGDEELSALWQEVLTE